MVVRGRLARFGNNIVLRVVAYYVALGTIAALLWRFAPSTVRLLPREAASPVADGGLVPPFGAWAAPPIGTSGAAAALAMLSAVLLAVPVSWLYILAREKKGYRQSVVQTLVLLPPVVAGVVVLVKHSLALAFALAGIVAAVRFRNTLEDSKDAVYIFLATAIGLAAGVDLSVAFVLSALFNGVIVALWYTDFGRDPANLRGRAARERLERTMAIANRTGEFVAMVDRQILEGMSPAQLDALVDRAWRRRRGAPAGENGRPGRVARLRLHATDAQQARHEAERLFLIHVKRWTLASVERDEDGAHVIEYDIQLRKSSAPQVLLDALRSQEGEHITSAELE